MAKSSAHENLDERLLHRLLFFTDAVFAIVMTILVLELRAPEGHAEASAETLRHATPHIAAFVFSFFIIGIFWVAHLNTTRKLAAFDWPTAWANLAFLLPLCLIPYGTAWLGSDLSSNVGWSLYCWILVATSLGNVLVVLASHRAGGRLMAGGATPRQVLYRTVRASVPGVAFAVGLVMLALGQTILSRLCWALIGPLFLLAQLAKPREG